MLVLLSLLSEGVPLLIVTPHSHSHLHELLVLLVPSSDVPVPSFLPQLILLLLLVARTYHDKLLIPPSLHEDVLVPSSKQGLEDPPCMPVLPGFAVSCYYNKCVSISHTLELAISCDELHSFDSSNVSHLG